MSAPYIYSTEVHPCTHCGFCCLATPCQVGLSVGFPDKQPCPALEWDEQDKDKSRCGLLANPKRYLPPPAAALWQSLPEGERLSIMDSGTGCSMKARVVTPEGVVEFAPLAPEIKVAAAHSARAGRVVTLHTKK